MLNLLEERLIRIRRPRAPTIERVSLPELLALMARDEVASFPALRAHQRFAWHAFLVQLAAIGLHRAGRTDLPVTAGAWAELLRALTPDHADDAPWCLVAPHDRPALLQAAVPNGDVGDFKLVPTPDALDMLVTSRNHDLKRAAMLAPEPDDWLMALVTVQTMDGGLSGSYRGIARMNSDYGSRPCLSVRPDNGPGTWFSRDLQAVLRERSNIARFNSYPERDGRALLWLNCWDGIAPLYRRDQLDPLFIEFCRRVRLKPVSNGQLVALKAINNRLIDVGFAGGITGDPWAPINLTEEKIFTISRDKALRYSQCVDLIDATMFRPSPLQIIDKSDSDEGLTVFAAAMVRGSGKTGGYHERRIPISKAVQRLLFVGAADRIAAAGQARVRDVSKLSALVLRPALYCLLRDGKVKAPTPRQRENLRPRAKRWTDRLDREVDASFFPDLWRELEAEDEEERSGIKNAWLSDQIDRARGILDEASRAVPLASMHRYRARTRAKSLLHHLARKHFPQLYPERTDAADTGAA